MKEPDAFLIVTGSAVLLALAAPCTASIPCECMARPAGGPGLAAYTRQNLGQSQYVFQGTVEVSTVPDGMARFRVRRWYKGGLLDSVSIRGRRRAGMTTSCDILFKAGEEWLIFAAPDSVHGAYTMQCSATEPLARSDSVRHYLGQGWEPRRGLSHANTQRISNTDRNHGITLASDRTLP